jgi:hypothetical protein
VERNAGHPDLPADRALIRVHQYAVRWFVIHFSVPVGDSQDRMN